jgi:exosortase A-associated hydrolase 2
VKEKHFFFTGSAGRKLMGFLHYASSPSNSIGIIYCHPFAEEKNMSHSLVVKSCRKFAKSGFHVMRFDFSGCGDSEGDLKDSTVSDWQYDLNQAIKIFKAEVGIEKYYLWGLRMGAGIAIMHAKNDEQTAGLILWQPPLNFSIHIKQFLRRAFSTEITKKTPKSIVRTSYESVSDELKYIIGYPISKKLISSFRSIDNAPEKITLSKQVLIITVSLLDQLPPTLRVYVDNIKKAGSQVTCKHITTEPFWDRYWQWECDKADTDTLCWLIGVQEINRPN